MRKKNQSTDFLKACIADALIGLMQEHDSYSEINVSMICDRAGVGRTTYYRHFDNRDGKDMALQFKVAYEYGIYYIAHQSARENGDLALMRLVFDFMDSQKELLMLMEKHGVLSRVIDPLLLSLVQLKDTDSREDAYYKTFFASSLTGIISRWVKTGCEDSPEFLHNLVRGVYPD